MDWAMGARSAGVVCTVTTGSFSFSSLPQPLAMQSIAAITPMSAIGLRKNVGLVFVVEVMESSEPRQGLQIGEGHAITHRAVLIGGISLSESGLRIHDLEDCG